jgi:cell shape-determining protein MreC
MSAKAKLLLRELKTVKADLAFAKERCAQLEDENKMLRESQDNGDNPEDDDLVSVILQIEREKLTIFSDRNPLASCYVKNNLATSIC